MLFWENQFHDDVEEQDLHAFYDAIASLGYRHIWVFDNFGNLMLAECSYAALHDLNRYIISQERHALFPKSDMLARAPCITPTFLP